MEQDILKKLEEQKIEIDKIYASVEKTRKWIMWTAIVTVGAIALPLIGLAFAIPAYLATLSSITGF